MDNNNFNFEKSKEFKMFEKQPKWSEEQIIVLQSSPNTIISGESGSGKTLLASHLAIELSKSSKVSIIVMTKSLKKVLNEYLKSLGYDNKINLYHKFEWNNNEANYDIIIVDEFQDFSIDELSNINKAARKGVYFFGDDHQKIYKKDGNGNETTNLKDLTKISSFPVLKLNINYRLSQENICFINQINKQLTDNQNHVGEYPEILKFNDVDEEKQWLITYLKNNTQFENIGILLSKNNKYKGGYFYYNSIRIDEIPGIIELKNTLETNNIRIYYKHEVTNNTYFNNETNINLMTYHSAKGLQFDLVILPFCGCSNDIMEIKNLFYVGLTRSTKKIIITYSGFIHHFFNNLKAIKNYNHIKFEKSNKKLLAEYEALVKNYESIDNNENKLAFKSKNNLNLISDTDYFSWESVHFYY